MSIANDTVRARVQLMPKTYSNIDPNFSPVAAPNLNPVVLFPSPASLRWPLDFISGVPM